MSKTPDDPCGLNRIIGIAICNECLAGTAKGYACYVPGCHYFQNAVAVVPTREELEGMDMDVVPIVGTRSPP